MTWREVMLDPGSGWLKSIAFGNGRFVALNSYSQVLSSSNGTNWFQENLVPRTGALSVVAFGNGVFVAAGTSIFTSRDGSRWIERTVPAPIQLRAATIANGTFVAVGADAEILQTDPIIHLGGAIKRLAQGPQLKLRIDSQAGARLLLESSVDLQKWSLSQVVTNASGTFEWTDTASNSIRRFYRVREQ